MARTRTGSAEPGGRAPPEPKTRATRASASPGPSVIARRTHFRRDQPTPVLPQVATVQGHAVGSNKVVKKTGRTGGKRARSVEGEGRTEGSSGRGNGMVLRGGAGEIGQVRQILPLVLEDNGEEEEEEQSVFNASRYIPPRNTQRRASPTFSDISYTGSVSPFSSPEPEVTETQLEVEDMDVELMLEMFPDLNAYAKKLLDLLIMNPPVENLLRDLRVPGSKPSKRLRLYEQNFAASKSAYGTPKYLSTHYVEVALNGNKSFNPLLHKSNLAILAIFIRTTQELGDGTFEELKEIERDFPSQFGDVVDERNFQSALDLRTQTLVLGLVKSQDKKGFNPDTFLQYFFMETSDDQSPDITQDLADKRLKPWPGMKDIAGWEDQVLRRIKQIRTAFNLGKVKDEELVDLEKLMSLFPWDKFVERMSDYVKVRFTEIERLRGGKSIEDLVNSARNPQSLESAEEKEVVDERAQRVPESVLERPERAAALESDIEPLLQHGVSYSNLLPEAEAEAEAVAALQGADEMESLNTVPFRQLKKKLEQQERESLESLAIVVNAAQMRDLKRRKTEPAPRIPKVKNTPRMATSLGAQEAVGNNIAQAKFLKGLKSKASPPLRQLEYSDDEVEPSQKPPTPTPSAGLWKGHLKDLGKIRNKENEKSAAVMLPPPPPPHKIKRKFVDRQSGATRVSQIDEDISESPSKRQKVHKQKNRPLRADSEEEGEEVVEVVERVEGEGGEEVVEEVEVVEVERRPSYGNKGKGRLIPLVGDERDRPSYGNKGKSRAQPRIEHEEETRLDYGNDNEEDTEDMYEQDQREESEERRKQSRRNLPNTGSASTALSAPVRVSSSSARSKKQSITKSKDNLRQAARHRGSKGSRDSREESPIDGDASDEAYDDNENGEHQKGVTITSRVSTLAKNNHVKKAPAVRKTRKLWGHEQSELLVKKIGEVGCRWATIRDMRIPEFSGRTDVQLKDKARNIKMDFLKARIPLPHNFKYVTISRRQIEALKDMGIDLDYDEFRDED